MELTLEDVLTDIEMIKLAIKLESDTDNREKLERELKYALELLESLNDTE